MEALWIIFIIIAVIMRVLKVEDFKGKLPEEWGDKKLPPILKDWGFPWDDEAEPEDELPKQKPVRIKSKVITKEEQSTGDIQHDTAYEIPGPTSKSEDTVMAGHPLVNTDTIINGLIMSELLQPPKSKRSGWRNR